MIQEVLKIAKSLVTLADDLQRYQSELKDIRGELRDLTIIVHALAQDIKNSKGQTEQKHENLLLEIENRLLKYERLLPSSSKSPRKSKKKKAGKQKSGK